MHSNLRIILTASLLLAFALTSLNARAEYYLVYSAADNVTWLNGKKHIKKYKRYKHTACKPKKYVKKRRIVSPQISVYYVFQTPGCLNGQNIYNNGCLYPRSHEVVYAVPASSTTVVRYRRWEYYPDLTTADDDPSVHPDLNYGY